MNKAAFSRKAAIILIVLVGGSLAAALLAGMFGSPAEPMTAGANAFSKSALGHKGFVRLMQEEKIPVLVSRFRSGKRASENGMLMVLEPQIMPMKEEEASPFAEDPEADPEDAVTVELDEMLARIDVAVVALPKRVGFVSSENPAHIESAILLPEDHVNAALDAARVEGHIVRSEEEEHHWSIGLDVPAPEVGELQLIDSSDVTPIISTAEGTFFGKIETRYPAEVYIVSDPDIFETHGVVNGHNAEVALGLVNFARNGRTVVIDETIHGYVQRPSLSRELTRVPLVLATVQVLLVFVLALWAGIQRFGTARAEPMVTAGGQLAIIENTAAVLEHSGHGGSTVARYLQMTMRDVERRLHAPSQRDFQARIDWLEKTATTKGVEIELEELRESVRLLGLELKADKAEVEALAGRVYRWRTQMLT